MKHKRVVVSSLTFVLGIIVMARGVSAASQMPRLSLDKTFFTAGEDIQIRYDGPPIQLDAHLTDPSGDQVQFKAVLVTHDGANYLDFKPSTNLGAGRYMVRVSRDDVTMIDAAVYWGSAVSITPSPTVAPRNDRVVRRTDSIMTPGHNSQVSLEYVAQDDIRGILEEYVPYDAIVEATGAAQIKDPSYLALGKPFNGDFELTDGYGKVNPAEHLGLAFHDGTDFAMPVGTPILAIDDGEVVPYHEVNHYGMTQAIQHSWGQSYYGHLARMTVAIGRHVKKGDVIGYSGNSGRSTGPHLHFGMKWGDSFVNGLPYIQARNQHLGNMKLVSWPITAKAGERIHVSYNMVMPTDASNQSSTELGPALIRTGPKTIIAQEPTSWKVSLQDISPTEHAQAPASDDSTLTYHNVQITYDDTQDAYTIHDMTTDTSFTRSADAMRDNPLVIDDTEFDLSQENGRIMLRQHFSQ